MIQTAEYILERELESEISNLMERLKNMDSDIRSYYIILCRNVRELNNADILNAIHSGAPSLPKRMDMNEIYNAVIDFETKHSPQRANAEKIYANLKTSIDYVDFDNRQYGYPVNPSVDGLHVFEEYTPHTKSFIGAFIIEWDAEKQAWKNHGGLLMPKDVPQTWKYYGTVVKTD